VKQQTIASILANQQDRPVSHRDAEILISWCLNLRREELLAHPEREITPEEYDRISSELTRRADGEPVAYITGSKEFYGFPFAVDHRALIPRPETEGIVSRALAHIATEPKRILEVGTGCGAISVAVAASLATPQQFTITEVDPAALALAQENWNANVTTPHTVTWLVSDLLENNEIAGPFDIVLANLPYVENRWQHDPAAQRDVVFWEPDLALFGGEDGLDLYRKFFHQLPEYVNSGATILAEHGDIQGEAMRTLAATSFPGAAAQTHQDYAGLDRILEVTLPA
jgi:release factor glutamine methyltransferase